MWQFKLGLKILTLLSLRNVDCVSVPLHLGRLWLISPTKCGEHDSVPAPYLRKLTASVLYTGSHCWFIGPLNFSAFT